MAGLSLPLILLTEPGHVNRPEAEITPRRIQNDATHSKWLTWQFPEQCLCFGINRGAQNGSRTQL